jgi:hypothetical protein
MPLEFYISCPIMLATLQCSEDIWAANRIWMSQ